MDEKEIAWLVVGSIVLCIAGFSFTRGLRLWPRIRAKETGIILDHPLHTIEGVIWPVTWVVVACVLALLLAVWIVIALDIVCSEIGRKVGRVGPGNKTRTTDRLEDIRRNIPGRPPKGH